MAQLAPVAGAARRQADALAPQIGHHIGAGIPHQRHHQNMGRFALSHGHHAIDGQQLLAAVGLHLRHMGQLVRQTLGTQLRRLGKARDLGRGLGAGAGALLLSAAVEQRADIADIGAHVQCADTLWPADLVGGNTHHVHPQYLRIAGHLHKALHRVGMQQCAALAFLQESGDLRHREHAAGLVVHQHHADRRRILPQRLAHLLCANVAGLVGLEIRHLIALLLQRPAGLQHGAVLHSGGDDMAAYMAVLPQGGLNGPVVALRAAGGKVQLLRLAAHHHPLGLLSHGILGGGIAELLRQHAVHLIGNSLGHRGGSGVIQINHNGFLSIFRRSGIVIPGRIKYNGVLFQGLFSHGDCP